MSNIELGQKGEHLSYNGSVSVSEIAMKGLVVYDNGPVYAILGNAKNDGLQLNVQDIKGEGRSEFRPVGFTVPFDVPVAQNAYDVGSIKHRETRKILDDPDELTLCIGGIAFLRAKANMDHKLEHQLPNSIYSNRGLPHAPGNNTEIQIYSPAGNAYTEPVINEMLSLGALPAMTSANKTTEPEIIFETEARRFAQETELPLIVTKPDTEKPARPRASYPTIRVTENETTIIRSGCIELDILRRLFYRFDPKPCTNIITTRYPHNLLRNEDLPFYAQRAKGEELRKYLLEAMEVDEIRN